jgi:hypothetical protein
MVSSFGDAATDKTARQAFLDLTTALSCTGNRDDFSDMAHTFGFIFWSNWVELTRTGPNRSTRTFES